MADPSGRIIDVPVRSNFREGMTVLEYFISHARRPQGPRRHRAAHRGLRVPHPAPRRRRAGRDHQGRRLRHGEGSWIIRSESADEPDAFQRRLVGRLVAADLLDAKAKVKKGAEQPLVLERNADDHRGDREGSRRRRDRRGARPVAARVRVPLRRLPQLLRPQPRHRRDDRHRRGGGHHRGPVNRRARHAAHHADVPHRRRRRPGHHAGPAARRGAVRGPHPQGQGRDQPHRRHRRGARQRDGPQGQGHQPRGVRHAGRAARGRRAARGSRRPRRGQPGAGAGPRRATPLRR